MATVFKKTYTKPLPDGVETVTRKGARFARWKDRKGKRQTAKVTMGKGGSTRIIVEAATYTAKYRNGSGIVREVSTGCRDETAARGRLAELVRRAELVRSGVVKADEDRIAGHQQT